jgi:7,8-dihydropterin-6-yl-methyl-4-(beta-D-ribofuranosyl)aminobenzene 5'-phosphate synthase
LSRIKGLRPAGFDLKSFEKVLSPTTMKIGRVGAFGCYPEAFAAEEREKGSFPDQFRHEIGTAYNLKGAALSFCLPARIVASSTS